MALPHECLLHIMLHHLHCSTFSWGFHLGSFPIIAASGGLMAHYWSHREEGGKQLEPILLFECYKMYRILYGILRPRFFRGIIRETWDGGAPTDCWKWGEWGLKENKRKGSFLAWLLSLSSGCKRFLFCRLKKLSKENLLGKIIEQYK